MPYTDDPIQDFLNHDAEQQAYLDKLPKCANCKQPIQQETAVVIEGHFYCDTCIEDMRECVDYE